jgi:hypothetical protein
MDSPDGRGGIPESPATQPSTLDIRGVLDDAILLHRFAAERNKTIGEDVTRTLCEARAADAAGAWTPDLEVRFWSAYRKLNSVISPITADTIRAISAGSPRPGIMGWLSRGSSPASAATRRYRIWGVLALAYVLYLQIYLALGGSVLADVVRLCPSLGEMKAFSSLPATQPVGTETSAEAEALTAARAQCTVLVSRPGAQDASQAPAADALLFSSSMDVVHRMNKMNLFWFFHWYFQDDGLSQADYRVASIYYLGLALDIISRYLLPLLYGLVGTCAYIIRTVSVEIQNVLYSQETHSRYQLRLFLGALAGLSAAWFVTLDGQGVKIPAVALSFLAGYSVELVFTAMDRLVAAFGAESGKARPTAPAPGS